VKDDYKKELWKTIKPTSNSPLTPGRSLQLDKESSLFKNEILDYYNKYIKKPDFGLETEYKLNPNLTKYNGKTPVNQLPPGSTRLVYMGGHFYSIPAGGTLVVPSGINLGGEVRKIVSERSKSILINVLGMEIED